MPKAAKKKINLKAGRSTCRKISLCMFFCLFAVLLFLCLLHKIRDVAVFYFFRGIFMANFHTCANANNCIFTFFGNRKPRNRKPRNPLEFACTVFRFLFSNKIFPPLFSEADWVYFSKNMTCLKKKPLQRTRVPKPGGDMRARGETHPEPCEACRLAKYSCRVFVLNLRDPRLGDVV